MPPVLHRQAEAGRHRRTGGALRAPVRPAQVEREQVRAVALGEPAPERRTALLRAKLGALVGDRWGAAPGLTFDPFPGGLAARRGASGWVLADDQPARSLGGALAWARRHGIDDLHLLVDDADAAGALARRATAFAAPPSVWIAAGRSLGPAAPAPLPAAAPPDERTLGFAPVLAAAGARPVVELDGTLVGEVLGLEVARTVLEDGAVFLEVGVGKHDREVQRLLLGSEPDPAAVAEVVRRVARQRLDPRGLHPLARLSPERWLADVVAARPEVVGAGALERRPTLTHPGDLRQRDPACLTGSGVVAVCSVGLDPDLVPEAADLRAAYGPGARLVIVVPEGDDHPATRALAEALAEPGEVVTVPRDWRSWPTDRLLD